MAGFFNGIAQWIAALPWLGVYYVLRVVFIVLDAAIVVAIVYALKKALEYRPDLIGSFKPQPGAAAGETAPRFDVKRYAANWEEIISKALSNPPESLTLAIVAADNLVGDALDDMHLEGEHIADKLAHLNARELKTLNPLWRAHRIRNDLVHTTGFEIKEGEAKEVLNIYAAFLKELGALE